MTGMSWRIDHECPQCGGPITLAETDRFFTCSYCRVRLYITSKGPFRYCLLPKEGGEDLLYIPYWRFKGTAYAVTGIKIQQRFMDHTRIASPIPELPFSLGVRPQALALHFADGDIPGGFVKPAIAIDEVISGMEKQLNGLGVSTASPDARARAYVGETTSIIYAPFKIKGKSIYDAITPANRYPLRQTTKDLPLYKEGDEGWSPGFLPAICPHCGWDLAGERDSCVFICKNCSRAWATAPGGLEGVSLGFVPAQSRDATYIPFWRIKPRVKGIKLETYADLVQAANLPKVVQPQWETTPLMFWAPAFKITPKFFLRLGGLLTITPPDNIIYENPKLKSIYPVNLPLAEAAEGLKIFFASISVTKKGLPEKLSGMRITPQESELILLPFVSSGSEFIYEGHNIAIQKAGLTHSRNF